MKGHPIRLSLYEEVFLEVRAAMPRRELHALFCETFGRDDVSEDALKQIMLRNGWKTGRSGCFVKGQEPHNKGKPHPAAKSPACARTQFKKGERSGRAEALHKPIGAERVSKDGYLERKVHNGLPMQSRWRAVQLIRWEERNGPLPEGHVLKCLSDDKANTDPSNWEAIPRALLPRLNGGRFKTRLAYAEAEPEVRPALLAIAKLEHAAREARKERAE